MSFLSTLLCLLFLSVCRAQINLYSPNEFLTVPANATVCDSSMVLGDLVYRSSNFTWTLDSNNYMNWTREELFYPVLGSIQCLRGQGLIWDQVWKCNPDVRLTGDLLGQLICPATATVPKFSGVGHNVFCSVDFDTLPTLTCPPGSLLRSNGTSFVCSADRDLLTIITGCAVGDLLRYSNGAWGCGVSLTDSDTLKALIPNCTNNFIPKFINGVWVCARDNDVLRYLNCPTGSRVQRSANGTAWVCGPKEQDTFRDITLNCTGNRDTPFFTLNNGWDCIPTPAINNSLNLGTLLYEWFLTIQRAGQATTSPASQLQPYLLPYAGQFRGFQMKVLPINGVANLTATLLAEGVPIVTANFVGTRAGVAGRNDLAIPFPRSSNITFTLSSSPFSTGGGYVEIGVYTQVFARDDIP
jgi:hypothetical protein